MQGSTRKIFVHLRAAMGIAVVALGFSGFASASTSDDVGVDVRQTEVDYTDLKLVNEADAAQLYTRLERAANHVCRAHYGPSARAQRVRRECEAQSLDQAVQRVSHPNLTSLHQTRSGKRSMVASSR